MDRHVRTRKAPADRRGVALLVALGVLVVLALLGAVFATTTGIERAVARNYVDKVRARLLAQSGVEHAFSEIQAARCLDIWSLDTVPAWVYYGSDREADGQMGGSCDRDRNGDTFPDMETVPLREAARPSFAADLDGDGLPDLLPIDGVDTGFSGVTGVGTYAPRGNLYTLRVTDLQNRININNRHEHLVTILNNLAKRLTGSPAVPANLGERVVAVRDRLRDQRFAHINQLVPSLGEETVERLRLYLTVNSWTDTKVIKPIGLAAGKRRKDFSIGDSVYEYWALRPVKVAPPEIVSGTTAVDPAAMVFEPRSPLNINTAPKEILAAALEGITGHFIKEVPLQINLEPYRWHRSTLLFSGNNPIMELATKVCGGDDGKATTSCGQVGILYATPPIGPKTADNIAAEILKARSQLVTPPTGGGPAVPNLFRSYQEVYTFLDNLPDSVFDAGELTVPTPPGVADPFLNAAYVRRCMRDALKANFDSNCHLNELNPDDVIALKVDKSDLTYWTFEFCYIPMGHFEVESLGRVVDNQGREVASARLITEAKIFDVHRDTLQAEFQRDLYMNDANDAIEMPASVDAELRKTFSAGGAGWYPKAGHLACYPELYYDPQHVKESWYDGFVGLLPRWNLPGNGEGATLRAHMAPRTPGERGIATFYPEHSNAAGFYKDPGGGPWYDQLVGGAEPGTLFPDGAFSEKDTSLGYDNRTYFNQHRGMLALWAKIAFEPENSGKGRCFLSCQPYDVPKTATRTSNANPFAIAFYNNHLKDENRNQVLYHDRVFPRSVIMGYAGAHTRSKDHKLWHNQPDNYREQIVINGTPTLNHIGHLAPQYGCNEGASYYKSGITGNVLKPGRWVLMGYKWNDTLTNTFTCRFNGSTISWGSSAENAGGQNLSATRRPTVWGPPGDVDGATGHQQDGQFGMPAEIGYPDKWMGGRFDPPAIRLGAVAQSPACSAWCVARKPGYKGKRYPFNFPADTVIDEVFIWPGDDTRFDSVLDQMWKLEGRFYKSRGNPEKSGGGDLACFTSARVGLTTPSGVRPPPPRGNAPLPGGAFTAPSVSSGTAPVSTAQDGRVRLGLVVYNLRVPYYDRLGLYAPQNPSGTAQPRPRVYFDILDADTKQTLLDPSAVIGKTDATMNFHLGGGVVTFEATRTGKEVWVNAAQDIRYRFWLDSGLADPLNDPYTASPLVDDVIVTYAPARPEILSWSVAD